MPSTQYTDVTLGARTVGARTDNVGGAVDDLSAEEDRYAVAHYSGGRLLGIDSFEALPGAGSTFDIIVGSTTAKADYYVVAGTDSGQGQYTVRLEAATETVVVPTPDGSNPRIDELYIVVQDDVYDGLGNALPRFGYREGDPAASPSAPGADAAWDAAELIATIDVPTSAFDILACTITDERVGATVTVPSAVLLGGGLDMGAGDISTTGDVSGIDLNTHDHDGVAGGKISALDLTDLTTAVDAANIDADTLDGLHAAGLTLIAHTGAGGAAHADVIAGGADGFMTGADKSKLDGMEDTSTADETPAQHLAKIITVDGAGTGLDAGLFDGFDVPTDMVGEIVHMEVNVQQGDVLFGASNTDHHSWTFNKPAGWTQYDMIVMAYPWYKLGGAGSHAETFVTATGSGSASSSSRDSEISGSSRSCTVPVTVVVTTQTVNNTIKMTSKKLDGGTGITADGTTYCVIAIRTA